MKVLTDCVMQTTQFFSISILEGRHFKYRLNRGLMNEAWAVKLLLQTINCFLVMIPRPRQTINGALSSTFLQGMFQLRQLLKVRKLTSAVHRDLKLFPKNRPVYKVSIKSGNVQSG